MPQAPRAREEEGFVERSFEALGFRPLTDFSAAPGRGDGADYCVRAEGRPVFFVGTNSLSREASYKLRRYGWSAQLPASVLLTSEELVVLDCRARPSPEDEVSESILFLFPAA